MAAAKRLPIFFIVLIFRLLYNVKIRGGIAARAGRICRTGEKAAGEQRSFFCTKGEICTGSETGMEVRCPARIVQEALRVIREIRPCEEPVINVLPLPDLQAIGPDTSA